MQTDKTRNEFLNEACPLMIDEACISVLRGILEIGSLRVTCALLCQERDDGLCLLSSSEFIVSCFIFLITFKEISL